MHTRCHVNKSSSLQEIFACNLMRGELCYMYHAGSFIDGKDGTIIAAAFGGSFEGRADTAIYVNVISAHDGSFLKEHRIKISETAHWNPVLERLDDKIIALIFKVGNVIAKWQSYITLSYDEGHSWSEPCELVAGDEGGRGPVRNKPIRLKSGALLCPASLEDGPWRAFVDRSEDNFKTLHRSDDIYTRDDSQFSTALAADYDKVLVSAQSFAGAGIIQPSLWQDESGVHMLLRSSFGTIMRSDSIDDGRKFCEAYPIDMPNNNSALDLDVYKKDIYLVCNPVGANFGKRSPLSIFISQDGYDFLKVMDLETQDGCEFSYPCVRVVQGRYLWVGYTYKRQNIKLRVFKFI